MSEADWTECTDVLPNGSIRRAVTAGATPPPGGGSFVYGWNSVVTDEGAHALFANQVSFAPMAKGGRVTAAMKRSPSGGPLGFAPFIFVALQGTSVNDEAYMLGLADGDPSHVVLKKGALVDGLPDLAPGGVVLRRSVETVAVDAWKHLRLDVITNTNGDVRLQVFKNDLDANPLSGAPVWTAIPGMAEFIDDALGVNSGSLPFVGGYSGFGFWSTNVTRRAQIDHLEVTRQL